MRSFAPVQPHPKSSKSNEIFPSSTRVRADAAQKTLNLGAPGDTHEREADQVADRVMRMPMPAGHVPTVPVRRSTGILLPSSGEPLTEDARAFFEPRFGRDLSSVRVHAGEQDAESARALHAKAYTTGHHLVFDATRYAPRTAEGRRLLAHELAHVIQQSAGTGAASGMVQRQLADQPTKFVTSKTEDAPFPEDDEPILDKRVKERQAQKAPHDKGMYLGKVTYKNLPPPSKSTDENANIERRAAKQALLSVITEDVEKRAGHEMRLRVPLDDSPVSSDFAMVILRFDSKRDVEVEFAGSNAQSKGSAGDADLMLKSLGSTFNIKFVSDKSPAVLLPGEKSKRSFPGKTWSANDASLLSQALPLLGGTEKADIKGDTFRRLAVDTAGPAAGFFNPDERSINLADSALPIDKALWFGEGGKFYTRGVHTVLHEVGHALHDARVATGKSSGGTPLRLDLFKQAVLDESTRRTKSPPGAKFPPPGIILPTDYASTSWKEFFADTYSLFNTNPSFLKTPEFQYLFDFFTKQFSGSTP